MTDESKAVGEEQKQEEPTGNYKSVINGEEVTTVVTGTTHVSTDTTHQPRKENQVKITVAADAPMEEG